MFDKNFTIKAKGDFIARFFTEFEKNDWREIAVKKYSIGKLTDFQFHLGNKSFLADITKAGFVDNKGRPNLFYKISSHLPNTVTSPIQPSNFEMLVSTKKQVGGLEKEISSSLYDEMFRRGKLRAFLSSMTKNNQPIQWYVYLALGIAVGYIISLFAQHAGY